MGATEKNFGDVGCLGAAFGVGVVIGEDQYLLKRYGGTIPFLWEWFLGAEHGCSQSHTRERRWDDYRTRANALSDMG